MLLDIDHTPGHVLNPSHAAFYSLEGLGRLASLLRPDGVFALWSDDPPDPVFLEVLRSVFVSADGHVVSFPNPHTGGTSACSVYVARHLRPAYDGDDFYCDVAIPHPERLSVVHDSEKVLAFHHTRPFWETHVVVTPKQHLASFTTLTAKDEPTVRELLAVAQSIARDVEESTGAAAVLTNLGRTRTPSTCTSTCTAGLAATGRPPDESSQIALPDSPSRNGPESARRRCIP